MEVDVLQENLAKAVTLLSRATPKRNSLAILENLLIETDKGRLAVSASDLELYASQGLIHDSEAGVYVLMPMTVEW